MCFYTERNQISLSLLSLSLLRTMTMFGSRTNVALGIICILLTTMSYCPNADLAQDKKECGNQLASLSPCLDFVEGNSKAPSKQCCVDLGKMITTTKKCLCVLVKDRNDANLSFKVNATLALSLPFICHAPANISECPDLLHLPPNSTDAQVFLQFSSPSVPSVSSNAPMEASSATSVATRIVRRLLGASILSGASVSFYCLIVSILIISIW